MKTGKKESISLKIKCKFIGIPDSLFHRAVVLVLEGRDAKRSTMLWVLLLLGAVGARPMDDSPDPMQNPDLFGGDMLDVDVDDRNVIPGFQLRWPAGDVAYEIDPSLDEHKAKILDAMKHYEELTCVRFKKRTLEINYIRLFSGQGCYSHVGMIGRGQQPVSLGRGCIFKGTIVHELGHALGFYHEQNRSDRDDFLIIYWDNIKEGLEDQFTKLGRHQNTLLDTFDYNSVMLYGNTAFSKDGVSNTMVAKTGVRLYETYDKPGLSASDVKRVRKMYWCDEPWNKKD